MFQQALKAATMQYLVDDANLLVSPASAGRRRSSTSRGMSLKGLDSAVFEVKDKTKFARLKSLSFVKDNHKTLDNMNEFMDKCKKCKEIR